MIGSDMSRRYDWTSIMILVVIFENILFDDHVIFLSYNRLLLVDLMNKVYVIIVENMKKLDRIWMH